jgi:hypothetical protein
MKPFSSVLTAACLSASLAFAFAPTFAAAPAPAPQHMDYEQGASSVTLPAGITAKDLKETKGIENAFTSVDESALGKDPLNNIIDRLVDQDRDRLTSKDKNAPKGDELTNIVKQIDDAWHAKYHQDLKFDNKTLFADTYFHAATGEVANPDQLVGQWPVEASGVMPATGGQMTSSDAKEAHKNFGGDVNLEKGRNVAVVHLAPGSGMPGVTASMILEHPSSWRFDVPNSLTREKLYSNLVANLTALYGNQANWPSDPTLATRALTNSVVASLYDINVQNAGQAHLNMGQTNRTAGER